MGFVDKAKQMAEHAQAKLDEAQAKLNESRQQKTGAGPGDPAVQYDQHGRPVGADAPAPPAAPEPVAAASEPEPVAPGPPPATPLEPPAEGEPAGPPPMTSGDPLAG